VLTPFGAAGPLESDVEELHRLELFLNFGRGFHSNDARAALGDPRANLMTLATGAEIGARTRLFERVTVAVDGFWLGLQDELVFVGDEGTTESAGRTRRLGVELVAQAELTEWLYLRGDAAYTSPRLVSGDQPLPQAARFVGKSAIGVRFGGFAAELGVRSLGTRRASEDPGDPRLRSYAVLDFGMRYRSDAFEVGIDFENLANARWRSSEFFYASCPPSDVPSAQCPAAGGGDGIPDHHFTAGNPFNVRGWASLRF
jgi:outer membrane receptor protein involved in Fe transport